MENTLFFFILKTLLRRKNAGKFLLCSFQTETLNPAFPAVKAGSQVPGRLIQISFEPALPDAGLFAQFLSELDYYSSLGADIYTDFQLTDRQLTITYCIPVPSFSVVKSQIDDFHIRLLLSQNIKREKLQSRSGRHARRIHCCE